MHEDAQYLPADALAGIDAYWRAANYLSVGQIYLLDNPLLREPLRPEHVKPRLLGHWGTTPGLNLIYAHMNRAIRARDLDAIYIIGPGPRRARPRRERLPRGHLQRGLPEHQPRRGRACGACSGSSASRAGSRSHVAPGDARLDPRGRRARLLADPRLRRGVRQPRPPGLLRRRRRRGGDRAAGRELALEQVPRPGPRRGGPADPPPQRLQDREPDGPRPDPRVRAARACSRATGTPSTSSTGDDPATVHRLMAATLDRVLDEIAAIQAAARRRARRSSRPRWPMIVLRTPKGWTGPREVDGQPFEGTWRVPPGAVRRRSRRTPAHLALLETWLRSYRPEELFDATGALVPELAARPPTGDRRMSANPHAQRRRAAARPAPAGLPGLRRGRPVARDRPRARRPACSASCSATSSARTRTPSACSGPTRPPRTACRRCSRRPTGRGWPRRSPATTTWPATGGSWRSSRSISARAGWRATC